MGPEDLANVLGQLPEITDPNVLVGTKTADDAAVYRVSDDLAIIQTVDFFTPIVDDPFMFGTIAAANSLSDVYAMGGKPVMALNVVGFPRDSRDAPMPVLVGILQGGAKKAKEAGIDILGGHTVNDKEPKYGLSVTGFVHPEKIWKNVGARPSDRLVVTKALGTGIISTAVRAGATTEQISQRAIESMALLNRVAAEVGIATGINACTDITGFGFLGHLLEMVSDESVGVRVRMPRVPVLEGTRQLAIDGYVPGGSHRNARSVAPHVTFDPNVDEIDRQILSDAQTSGGLLFAVGADRAGEMMDRLRSANVLAAEIGEFTESDRGTIRVEG